MHIHIKGNTYLVSDEFQMWIQTETPKTDKKGNPTIYAKRLTGYHSDFDTLFNDYFDRSIRRSDIDGDISDLTNLVKKTRAEIKKLMREIRGNTND